MVLHEVSEYSYICDWHLIYFRFDLIFSCIIHCQFIVTNILLNTIFIAMCFRHFSLYREYTLHKIYVKKILILYKHVLFVGVWQLIFWTSLSVNASRQVKNVLWMESLFWRQDCKSNHNCNNCPPNCFYLFFQNCAALVKKHTQKIAFHIAKLKINYYVLWSPFNHFKFRFLVLIICICMIDSTVILQLKPHILLSGEAMTRMRSG